MPERYAVRFDGHLISITETPDGPWSRWEMARAAAMEHLEDHVRECERTLMCIRRAGNFYEYQVLREEMEVDEVAQVAEGGTLT